MRRSLALAVALAALLTLSVAVGPAHAGLLYSKQLVVGSLDNPVGFTITKSAKIYYGERGTGEIRAYSQSAAKDRHVFTIPDVVNNLSTEQGLIGLALHPRFPSRSFIYAYATRTLPEGDRNQILKIKIENGQGTTMTPIFTSNTPSVGSHNGGRIKFFDDRLFAIIGDGQNAANSQNLSVDGGKVLRMSSNGNVPGDNPFPGSRVFATGIRNSIGFDFDPVNGRLQETENGPSCNDELNLIASGANMGWGPTQTCANPPPNPQNTNQDGTNPVLPLDFFASPIAVTGMTFCPPTGCSVVDADGQYFFGANNTGDIWQVALNAARDDIASKSTVLNPGTGAIYSMEAGPDGTIYFSSSDGGIYKLLAS